MKNQIMHIQIGNFGVITIGHQTKMGDVAQVIEMGNANRKLKKLETITLDQILKKQDLWEFIISRNTQIKQIFNSDDSSYLKNNDNSEAKKQPMNSDYSELLNYKTLEGKIQYGELMKKYSDLIKSRRGRYGGTWAELYILLKIASMLDKDLEVEIYRVFIENKILEWREEGGENYKELNSLIDTLSDRINENNSHLYRKFAMIFRHKLEITTTKGYNQKEHDILIQQKRAEWLKYLITVVDHGFVKTADELEATIYKLK
jgi:hypothetical protein